MAYFCYISHLSLTHNRGIDVSYEAIRAWCQKFGQQYANQIRRRRPRPADKWHLDEVELKINGKKYYLWRAVDTDGNVFDILMQRHRDKAAAKKFFRKLLKKQGVAPRVMVTDKLKSYGAALALAATHCRASPAQRLEQPLQRTPTNRHERDRDGCGDSNPLVKRNDFSPLLD